jgi:hypothetical protein
MADDILARDIGKLLADRLLVALAGDDVERRRRDKVGRDPRGSHL